MLIETMLPCIDNFVDYMDKFAETGESFDVKEYKFNRKKFY